MKVIAFNGSARPDGNCTLLVNEVFSQLQQDGIETELVQVSKKKSNPVPPATNAMNTRTRDAPSMTTI